MLLIRALFHGFDHVHLDLGYYGTKGLSSARVSNQSFRTGVPTAGGYVSIVLQSDRSYCYRYDCGGVLEYIRQLQIW